MVPPVSHRVSRVLRYSGSQLTELSFRLRDYHPLWSAFPCRSIRLPDRHVSPQPRETSLSVWPLPRSLATTCGISVDFFSSPYLDVSVQAVSLIYLWIQYMMYGLLHTDFSIRKSADQWIFAPPRSLSQLIASFIGSQCQGIRPALFLA